MHKEIHQCLISRCSSTKGETNPPPSPPIGSTDWSHGPTLDHHAKDHGEKDPTHANIHRRAPNPGRRAFARDQQAKRQECEVGREGQLHSNKTPSPNIKRKRESHHLKDPDNSNPPTKPSLGYFHRNESHARAPPGFNTRVATHPSMFSHIAC